MAFQKEPLRKNNKLTLADVLALDREYKGEKLSQLLKIMLFIMKIALHSVEFVMHVEKINYCVTVCLSSRRQSQNRSQDSNTIIDKKLPVQTDALNKT